LGVDDELARGIGFAHRDLHIADRTLQLAPFPTQVMQAFEAADIALAARSDAVGQPVLLAYDLAVELVARRLLLLEHGVAPGLEVRKAAVEAAGHAAIEPDRGARQVRKEPPVVA